MWGYFMPNIDLSSPIQLVMAAASVFGAGWTSCFAILVRPMRDRMTALETKLDKIEMAKDARIEALEQRLGIR